MRSLVAKAKTSPGLVGRDLVREVLPDQPFEWHEPLSAWTHLHGEEQGAAQRVAGSEPGAAARHNRTSWRSITA